MMWDRTTTSRRFCFFLNSISPASPFRLRDAALKTVSFRIVLMYVCMYVCIWFVPCNNSITNNAFFMVN